MGLTVANDDQTVLVAGPITADTLRHEARVGERELALTHREFELLCYLLRRQGRVASTDDIIADVWRHPADTNTVAVHVKRLRAKMGDDPRHGQLIRTVRGVGYQLAPSLLHGAGCSAVPDVPAG